MGHALGMTTDDLRAALKAAGDEFKAARGALEQSRSHLVPLMVQAMRDPDITQREIAALSGYNRESVRTIARGNGIEPE